MVVFSVSLFQVLVDVRTCRDLLASLMCSCTRLSEADFLSFLLFLGGVVVGGKWDRGGRGQGVVIFDETI